MLINPYIYTPSWSNTLSTTFDGVDDYVTMGNPTELQITGTFWYKSSGAGGDNIIALWKNASFGVKTKNGLFNQGVSFWIYNSFNVTQVTTSTIYNDGNWHNVTCVFIPSTSINIYVDGVLDATNTTSIPATIGNSTDNFYLGTVVEKGNPTQIFNGNLDEVAVWNTDQTANVSTIYNSGTPQDLSSLSPVGYWRMGDGDTYPTLTDYGSGGNNGTMVNMSRSNFVADVP